MRGAVLVRDLRDRRGFRRFVEQGVDGAGRIRVQHEKLTEMCVCMAQQLESILFGSGERLLMPMHHAGGILLDRAERDEALAHEPLTGIRQSEFLEIREDSRLLITLEDSL